MNSLVSLKTLASILEEDSWCVRSYCDENVIVTAIQGDKAIYRVLICLQPESDKITYQILYQFKVPEDRLPVLAEAVTRFNSQIGVGSLFLDFDDGQVGFKHCLLMEDNGLTSRQFLTPLYIATSILDHYYPAFQQVMYAGISPVEAAASVESEEGEGDEEE